VNDVRVSRPRRSQSEELLAALRLFALWRYAEVSLANRAWLRLGCGVAWLYVAVDAVGVGKSAWGWLMVVGNVLSVLHSRRTLLMSTAGRLGSRVGDWGSRVFLTFFPYPNEPHFVDGPGFAETLGLILAALATGHWIDVFEGKPEVQLLTLMLMMVSAASYATNLIAHPSYEMVTGKLVYRLIRPLIAPAIGGVAALLLWPSSPDHVLTVATVIGLCAIVAMAGYWPWQLARFVAGLQRSISDSYDAGMLEVSQRLHGSVKNPTHGLLNALVIEDKAFDDLKRTLTSGALSRQISAAPDRTAGISAEAQAAIEAYEGTRSMVHQLATGLGVRVSSMVEWTRTGHDSIESSPQAITHAILRLYPGALQRYGDPVVYNDGQELAQVDSQILEQVLSEFISNAIAAHASALGINIAIDPHRDAPYLVVSVDCTCGRDVAAVMPKGGTLGLLAVQLRRINGALEVERLGSGRHRHIAEWPVTNGHASPISAQREHSVTVDRE
jgi:hypothetical protein